MLGIHAQNIPWDMPINTRVDVTFDFEFEGHFDGHKCQMPIRNVKAQDFAHFQNWNRDARLILYNRA